MARKDQLSVRQDQDSGNKCALARSREDVERKRHKRNPFDDSYVQLLQTPLEATKGSLAADADDSNAPIEIESTTTDLHVRVELMKTMKHALMKQTAEAVTLCYSKPPGAPIAGRSSRQVKPAKHDTTGVGSTDLYDPEEQCTFFRDGAYQLYCQLQAGEAVPNDTQIAAGIKEGGANKRPSSSLSYNLADCAPPPLLEVFLTRTFSAEDLLHVDLDTLLAAASASADERWLDSSRFLAKLSEVAMPEDSSQSCQTPASSQQATAEPLTLLIPSYLQARTDLPAAAGSEQPSIIDTDHAPGDDSSRPNCHSRHSAAMVSRITDRDAGHENWLHMPSDDEEMAAFAAPPGEQLDEDIGQDSIEEDAEGVTVAVPAATKQLEQGSKISKSRIPTLQHRRRAFVLPDDDEAAVDVEVLAAAEAEVPTQDRDDTIEERHSSGQGRAADPPNKQPTTVLHPSRPVIRPHAKRPRAKEQRDERAAVVEDMIEEVERLSTEEVAESERTRSDEEQWTISITPDFSLANLASLQELLRPPQGKLAYRPVADPESLLLPWPKLPWPSRPKPPLPDPKPSPELFLHSFLMPGKSMLDVSAAVHDQGAGLGEGTDLSLLLPTWPQSQPSANSLAMPVVHGLLGSNGQATVCPALQPSSVMWQGALRASQEAALSRLDSRNPVAQPPGGSTRPADDAASQLGVFADCSDDDEEDFALDLSEMAHHRHNPYSSYGFQSAGQILRQLDAQSAVKPADLPCRVPDGERVAQSAAVQGSMQDPSITATRNNSYQVASGNRELGHASGMDSHKGQASDNVVFAGDNEAGLAWETSDLTISSEQPMHAQPDASLSKENICQHSKPEGAATPQAVRHSMQDSVSSPAKDAAQDANEPSPDWERAASTRPNLRDVVSCAPDKQLGCGVSCKAPWASTAIPDLHRITTLLSQSAMTGQDCGFADSIVFADGEPDQQVSAGEHALQAAGALRGQDPVRVTAAVGTGRYNLDTGWAESAEPAASLAYSPALKGTGEQCTFDAIDGLVFEDSPEYSCPASPLFNAEYPSEPGVDSGHNSPDLSMLPEQAGSGVILLSNQKLEHKQPRHHAKRKCNAEDLRDKMIKELLDGKGRSRTLEPLVRCMQSELERCQLNAPDQDAGWPRLSCLQEACRSAGVDGSEASPQRHFFALLTLVQRNNTGIEGMGMPQLKLEAVDAHTDVCVARAILRA